VTRREKLWMVGTAAVLITAATAALIFYRTRERAGGGSDAPTDRPTDPPTDRPTAQATRNGVPVPGGQGDTIDLNHDANQVLRRDAAGNLIWATPLDGYLGLVRPPHLLTDGVRAYVSHADGVTALDARTGAVLWHSPGPADRMYLSGRLLLATDCSIGEQITKSGRWVTARDTTTGDEVFRVGLPLERFDPLPIEEAAGLILVQKWDNPGGAGLALLIDHAGQVWHRFDRQVVTARLWAGGDRLVLTSRDVVRLSGAGEVRWSAAFQHREWLAGGGFVPLPGGGLVTFLYGRINDSGVQVVRLDPDSGKQLWEAYCEPLGEPHSAYSHEAVVEREGEHLRVTSRGDGGTFVEVIDARDGKLVSRETPGR